MTQRLPWIMVLMLLAGCGGTDGDGSVTGGGSPEAAQAAGIAESVGDVEAAMAAASTPLPVAETAEPAASSTETAVPAARSTETAVPAAGE